MAKMFDQFGWSYLQIASNAHLQASKIVQNDLLIAATGVTELVKPEMVNEEMIVVDGSGIDVNIDRIEPLVKAVTPKRGAIGPLTIRFLFANLLKAVNG